MVARLMTERKGVDLVSVLPWCPSAFGDQRRGRAHSAQHWQAGHPQVAAAPEHAFLSAVPQALCAAPTSPPPAETIAYQTSTKSPHRGGEGMSSLHW
jgi:hypothetical protein